jgi:hypothetical protein
VESTTSMWAVVSASSASSRRWDADGWIVHEENPLFSVLEIPRLWNLLVVWSLYSLQIFPSQLKSWHTLTLCLKKIIVLSDNRHKCLLMSLSLTLHHWHLIINTFLYYYPSICTIGPCCGISTSYELPK